MRNLGEIRIFRATKSLFPNNHASLGPDDSIIVLYDSAKSFGYKQALAHEMGHILFSKLSDDEKQEYYSFANWSLIDRIETEKWDQEKLIKSLGKPDEVIPDLKQTVDLWVYNSNERSNWQQLKKLNLSLLNK